jgi:LIVCS family branched-chain amino acid:cation transporter
MKRTLFLCTLGFALFAMFFGAGNLVFPLKLGTLSQGSWPGAFSGFAVTGVLIPIMGFFAMTLYDGDYRAFFAPLGRRAGLISMTLILLLLGPLGAVARCLALCYSSVNAVYPSLSCLEFSLLAFTVVFLFSFRDKKTVTLLGKLLTPLKLITLSWLIFEGLQSSAPALSQSKIQNVFSQGLLEGLETLDLLAALAFSCFLIPRLKEAAKSPRDLYKMALKCGAICAALLAITYAGFCYIAARHAASLPERSDLLLISLSEHLMGPLGAKLTMLVVLLACLTTVIALSSIFAEFVKKELFKGALSYELSLALTLALSSLVSLLRFDGIVAFLLPIMEVSYPALIVLCIVNITSKLLETKSYERLSFFTTLGATLGLKLSTALL